MDKLVEFDSQPRVMDIKLIRQIYNEQVSDCSTEVSSLTDSAQSYAQKAAGRGDTSASFSLIISNEEVKNLFFSKVEDEGFLIEEFKTVPCQDGLFVTIKLFGWSEREQHE